MRAATCFSGIGAPECAAPSKRCAKCGTTKPLAEYHRQPSGPMGRHSYCKPCANEAQRTSRVRHVTPERKAAYQIATRYKLKPEDVARMMADQGGVCGICAKPMAKVCIDHCHETGQVRGLLCHGCNIKLSAIERDDYRVPALAYLHRHALRTRTAA